VGDLTPALVAIASIVTGLVALSRNLPRVRRLFGVDRSELIAEIRERAELWEDKAGLVMADLVAERTAHAETKALLLDEQRAGGRCRRELDDARSELRAIGHRSMAPRRAGRQQP
jgi:hypothetical protein